MALKTVEIQPDNLTSTSSQTWKPLEKGKYLFTIFTSAYNREKKIPRVYESLKSQTLRDFEWLIIDDGSIDNTRSLAEAWKKEADFPIRYYWKENGGHHSASNYALSKAEGTFFLTLDSDDGCVPETLEIFSRTWNSLPEPRERFSGITGLCINPDGSLIGDLFPKDIIDSDTMEMRHKYRIKGEKWGFTRTDLLRAHPFPMEEGIKWYPANIVWYAIGRKYKTRYINEKLRIYYNEPAHKSDQAAHFSAKKVAPGITYLHRSVLNGHIDRFQQSPLEFLRFAIHYSRFSFHTGRSVNVQYRELTNNLATFLWAIGLPIGVGLYLKDLAKGSNKQKH